MITITQLINELTDIATTEPDLQIMFAKVGEDGRIRREKAMGPTDIGFTIENNKLHLLVEFAVDNRWEDVS